MAAKPVPAELLPNTVAKLVAANVDPVAAKTNTTMTYDKANELLTQALAHLADTKVKLQVAAVAALDLILQTGDVRVMERMHNAIEADGLTRFNAWKLWVLTFAPVKIDSIEVDGKKEVKWRLNKEAVDAMTETRDKAAATKWWTTNKEIITVELTGEQVDKKFMAMIKSLRNEDRFTPSAEATKKLDALETAGKAALKLVA